MIYQVNEAAVGATVDAKAPFFEQFLGLPTSVYQSAATWGSAFALRAPVLKTAAKTARELERFSSDTARAFLVTRDGEVCARAVASLNPTSAGESVAPIGQIGYFESLDDEAATALLFQSAVAWLRAKGAARIIGPIDGDTWHRYRLNVGPYTQPFFLLEPINPPYYQRLWEVFGFEPLEEYYSARVDDVAEVVDAYRECSSMMRSQGYSTRSIDISQFERELGLLYDLTTEIFSGNFLYSPIGRAEYLEMYVDLKPHIRPEFLTFIYGPQGDPVGFLFAIPDLLEGAAPRSLNLKTLGIKREHRRAGLAKGLFGDTYQQAYSSGLNAANLCLIRNGNPSGNLDAGKGRQIRSYRLYELA